METAVDGIVGAIVRGTHIDVDMGLATSLQAYELYIEPSCMSSAFVHILGNTKESYFVDFL